MSRYVAIVTLLSLNWHVFGINPDNPFLDVKKLYPNNPFFQSITRAATTYTSTTTVKTTTLSSPAAYSCGLAVTANLLILGGDNTRKGEWPWITAIFAAKDEEEFLCGGSIINKRHIISAAHCFQNGKTPQQENPNTLVAYMGLHHLDQKENSNVQRIKIADIFINPEYNIQNFHNDIAVLRLKSPAQYTIYIKPLCLWDSSLELKNMEGKWGTIIGWGRNEQQTGPTNEPQRIDLPIVSQEECRRSNPQFELITSKTTFCAGLRNDTGPCNGDSGNGFILRLKENNQYRWYLRGITSLSLRSKEGSCDLSNFVVFTDVAKYSSWLHKVMKEE